MNAEMVGSRISVEEAAEMVWDLTPEDRGDIQCESSIEEDEIKEQFAERFGSEELELRRVSLADCHFGWAESEADTIEEYAEQFADGNMDYPPIMVSGSFGAFHVEDGNHRCAAFESLGLTHVYAYVPVTEDLEPLIHSLTPDLPFPE